MRLAVYTDYAYRRQGGTVYAERAFAKFLVALAGRLDEMVLVGRLNPEPGRSHYPLPPEIRFVPLPYYRAASRPLSVAVPALRSLRRFWRALDGVEGVWLLGPGPLQLAFAALALVRRRRVTLGVRQDTMAYIRSRHPGRRLLHLAALLVEGGYRALARRVPVIVVGPDLARRYRGAGRRVLSIYVSLVSAADIVSPDTSAERRYDGELRIVSVGRLETEKNPLLLADILARLCAGDERWRLVVCGEGPLAPALSLRLSELGVAERARLEGYVPIDGGLADLYRRSHVLLHVSWTEGVPQVLFEAFAAGLPVVATAVGGVPVAAGDSAELIPPGDAEAAAEALARLAGDADLRRSLTASGAARVRRHTIEAETERVAEFLRSQ